MKENSIIYVRKTLLISFLVFLFFIGLSSFAAAQDTGDSYMNEGAGWRAPTKISDSILNDANNPTDSRSPTIAADIWGAVHAIWVTDLDSSDQVANNAFYYSAWDGISWSSPIDFYLEPSGGLRNPKLIADADGWLHLTWTRIGILYYSRAHVQDAGHPNGWTKPFSPSGLKTSNVSLAVDSSNNIHVVSCFNQNEGYLAYQRTEGIDRWKTPVKLALTGGCWARIAVDASDRLHVAYTGQPGSAGDSAAYYLQSATLGNSWSTPITVDDGSSGYADQYGPSWINVAAIGSDEVHLVWQGSSAGQRWHQWSKNGGVSWSEPSQLFPEHRGLAEPVAFAADSERTIHLVSLGWLETDERPHGAFYSKWINGKWDSLSKITDRVDWDAGGVDMAIAGGNRLIASWTYQGGELSQAWTSYLPLDAPAVIHQPMIGQLSQTNPVSQSPNPINEDKSTLDPVPNQIASGNPFPEKPDSDLWFDPITTAVFIVALFLILTIAVGRYASKQNQYR